MHTPTLVINLNIKNESKAVLVLKGQKEGGKLLQFGYFFFFLILSSVLRVKLLEDQCVIIKDNN